VLLQGSFRGLFRVLFRVYFSDFIRNSDIYVCICICIYVGLTSFDNMAIALTNVLILVSAEGIVTHTLSLSFFSFFLILLGLLGL